MRNTFFILFILLLGSSCREKNESANNVSLPAPTLPERITLTREQMKMMGIETGAATTQALASGFSANGIVAVLPQNRAAVTAKMGGRLEEILVHEGQNVRKGQILFKIASSAVFDIQQSYLHAKADLLLLEKELDRQRSLQNSNAGAAKNLEEVQSHYFRAKADLESAAAKLQYLGISTDKLQQADHLQLSPAFPVIAPIAGNVTEIPISLGQSVGEGITLCNIVNASEHLHAHVEVFAQQATAIREGQPVLIHFPGGQHADMRSNVEYVSREINPNTRTVSLHVPLPDGNGIVPGMPLVAMVEQKPESMPALSEAAVLHDGASLYCFVVEKEDAGAVTFRRSPLTARLNTQGFFGLDQAATNGKRFAISGVPILEGELKKGVMQE
ncbi:MAG: efflux RND transporter periplasmic adaptor subunit [Bacteroidota bacterium]